MPGVDLGRLPSEGVGEQMMELVEELFAIRRSIAGEGLRQTLALVGRHLPLEITETPTGTQVLDWIVPPEWEVREAWIAGPDGRRVVDLADSSLHVVHYSRPVRARLPLDELRLRLYSLPEHPRWIPFHNTYYDDDWGFCLAHEQLEALEDGEYEVLIDSTLADGSVTYGETVLKGELEDEVLLTTYVCHSELASELTGIAVLVALARELERRPRRYTYRFLFSPATIGPITWLARNEDRVGRVRHGLSALCLGDEGPFTYKRSRRGDAEIDRAVACVLRDSGHAYRIDEFMPWGGDERQFCSPGFDLPFGVLTRTPCGEFPEYHTSADDLSLVSPDALAESLAVYLSVVDVLETNATYVGTVLRGEPQLGRRGLWRTIGAGKAPSALDQQAITWVLNLADGAHSLLDMAERSRLPFRALRRAAERLARAGLLRLAGSNAALTALSTALALG